MAVCVLCVFRVGLQRLDIASLMAGNCLLTFDHQHQLKYSGLLSTRCQIYLVSLMCHTASQKALLLVILVSCVIVFAISLTLFLLNLSSDRSTFKFQLHCHSASSTSATCLHSDVDLLCYTLQSLQQSFCQSHCESPPLHPLSHLLYHLPEPEPELFSLTSTTAFKTDSFNLLPVLVSAFGSHNQPSTNHHKF